MKTGQEAKELCLPCIVKLEEAGYEIKTISSGMVICGVCGRRCWGRGCEVRKDKAGGRARL